jgi:hypothetical protein
MQGLQHVSDMPTTKGIASRFRQFGKIVSGNDHSAAIRRTEPCKHVQEARFAAARWAEYDGAGVLPQLPTIETDERPTADDDTKSLDENDLLRAWLGWCRHRDNP